MARQAVWTRVKHHQLGCVSLPLSLTPATCHYHHRELLRYAYLSEHPKKQRSLQRVQRDYVATIGERVRAKEVFTEDEVSTMYLHTYTDSDGFVPPKVKKNRG